MIHQHRHATYAHDEGQGQANRQPLRAQEDDLQKRNKHRDCRQHYGRNPGGYTLLSPEQAAIIDHEDDRPKQRSCGPLSEVWSRSTFQPHPAIEYKAGNEKTERRQ